MSLDALEKAVADAQKQLAAKEKKERKEREAKENLSDTERIIREENAQTGQHAYDIAVQRFLIHCKMEPREILEARYVAMIGAPPPAQARHIWLVERVAYAFQIQHRMAVYGECPESILRNAKDQSMTYPGVGAGIAFDAKDPTQFEIWDDSYVVAIGRNPFSKGSSMRAFAAVEMSGEEGVAFEHLCKLIEGLLECSVDSAQEWALDAFTRKVREGLTKVVIK